MDNILIVALLNILIDNHGNMYEQDVRVSDIRATNNV
jgi:hypothetical protein